MRLGVAAAVVEGVLVPGDVEVVDGAIAAVGLAPGSTTDLAAPGLVDLHVNGFAAVDFASADAGGYRRAGEALLATGVTAYRPTLISAPEDELVASLAEVPAAVPGPRILGAHLEGPFLAPGRLGVHPPDARRDPDPALLERLLAAGPVAQMTLAPELPGALELVDLLRARGVVVACGHSDATAGQAHRAFDRGASTVTHVFNAMRPFRHRDPGLAGAALTREDVVVQAIADGRHLADGTLRLIWRAAGGRTALVTDAVAAARAGEGRFRLGAVEIEAGDGAARRTGDGALAGGTATLLEGVRRLHALGVPLTDALGAATAVPAGAARRGDVGVLRLGGAADVVVLDDRLELRRVLVGGTVSASA